MNSGDINIEENLPQRMQQRVGAICKKKLFKRVCITISGTFQIQSSQIPDCLLSSSIFSKMLTTNRAFVRCNKKRRRTPVKKPR